MARSSNNIATQGLSGQVGEFVFRQRFGKTFVMKKPVFSGKTSPAQADNRSRFREASRYAKAAISDPELKLFYRSRAKYGQSEYNAAVGDFCHAPVIGKIDASAYDGSVGCRIKVSVTDEGKVISVKVKIHKSGSMLLEEGEAMLQADGLHWVYTATVRHDALTGLVITVSATDLPGNSATGKVFL